METVRLLEEAMENKPRPTVKLSEKAKDNYLSYMKEDLTSEEDFRESIDHAINIYNIVFPAGFVGECRDALVARTQQEMDANPLSATTIAHAAGLKTRTDASGHVTCYMVWYQTRTDENGKVICEVRS